MSELLPGAISHRYWVLQGSTSDVHDGGVIAETIITIYVNGQELVTVMCSPLDVEALALGFLFNEGVIQSADEVGLVQANATRTVVDVILRRSDFQPPRRLILTAGCGMGVTLQQLTEHHPRLESSFRTLPEVLLARMRDLRSAARLYNAVRGVHTAVLADEQQVLIVSEDVGRHNTIDKLAGRALQAGISTQDRMIITSGRISSEMLTKARRMNVPVVGSRTAPTSTAVRLATAWDICIVGYLRRGSMRVYTAPHRLGLA